MQSSVAIFIRKLISAFFVLALVLSFVPATAFAQQEEAIPAKGESIDAPFSGDVINEEVALEPVAQVESTRSYLLASAVEGTRAIPVVNAELSIGDGSSDDSTVVGSFVRDGMTYAIEPDGESVALVAVDCSKLSEEVIRRQILVIPDAVSPDGIEAYSVTRIGDGAFISLTEESADASYVGCEALLADEGSLAEADIDRDELARVLEPEQDMVDIDGNDELESVADSLEGCVGILALGIPASVTSIEDEAFAGSDTLQYLVVSEDNPDYASFDGALYSADLATLRLIPEGRVGAVRIAPSAVTIDPEVFSHCPSVDEIIADADSAAFTSADGCLYSKDLTTLLRAPASVSSLTLAFECSSIGPSAFSGCNELVSIAVPGKVDHVDATAFTEKGHRADLASSGDAYPSDVPSESFIESSSSGNDLIDDVFVLLADGDDELKIPWREVGCANFELLEAADRIDASSAVLHDLESVSARSFDSAALRAARKVKVTVYGNGGTFDVTQQHGSEGQASVLHRGIAEYSGYSNGSHGIFPSNNPPRADWWLDADMTVCLVNPRSGYKFIGFSFTPDGGLIADGWSTEPYTNDVTIYCRWAANLQINGNGGTLTHRIVNGETLSDNVSVVNSTTLLHTAYAKYVFDYYPLPGSPCHQIVVNARSGFEFLGWSRVASGDASTILSENLTSSEPITLFARWAPLLTVHGNGGTLTKTSNSTHTVVDSGKSVMTQRTSSLTAYTNQIDQWDSWGPVDCYAIRADRVGYRFLGWSYAPDSEILSSDVTVVDPTEPITFYARWKLIDYSIKYVLDGEISEQKTSYSVEDADFTLPIAASTGYIFSGWDVIGASGAGVEGNGTTNVTIKHGTYGNLTATAKWTPVTYSVAYDDAGGTFSGKTSSYNIEAADFKLPTSGTRTGYTFAGWDVTGASGAGVDGDGTTNVTIKHGTYGNLTAKAKWTLNAYHLSWNVAHGTHANRTEDFTVEDCPIAMGAAAPDDGYSFTGWSGEKLSGDPSSFTLDASFLEGKADGATLSFAAGFSANPYTIRLHANDGTSTLVEHAVTYDAAVSSVSIPKRYGYAFSGYYVKEGDGTKGERVFDGHGSYLADSGIWKRTCDMDLYASWTIMGSLEVPLCDPSSLSFALDRATGEAMASPEGGSEAEGHLRSTMPEEVPLASVELESLADDSGILVMERVVGAENMDRCSMKLAFPSGPSDVRLRFASPGSPDIFWEFGPDSAPRIPAAVPAASGTSGDGVVQDELGNLAQEGELPLSYALALDAGFDVAKMPLANVSETVARLVFTVDLTGVAQERF